MAGKIEYKQLPPIIKGKREGRNNFRERLRKWNMLNQDFQQKQIREYEQQHIEVGEQPIEPKKPVSEISQLSEQMNTQFKTKSRGMFTMTQPEFPTFEPHEIKIETPNRIDAVPIIDPDIEIKSQETPVTNLLNETVITEEPIPVYIPNNPEAQFEEEEKEIIVETEPLTPKPIVFEVNPEGVFEMPPEAFVPTLKTEVVTGPEVEPVDFQKIIDANNLEWEPEVEQPDNDSIWGLCCQIAGKVTKFAKNTIQNAGSYLLHKTTKIVQKTGVKALDVALEGIFYCAQPIVKRLPDTLFGISLLTDNRKNIIQPPLMYNEDKEPNHLAYTTSDEDLINEPTRTFSLKCEDPQTAAFRYVEKVIKHKVSHTGLDFMNQRFLEAFQLMMTSLAHQSIYTNITVSIHACTFDEAYKALEPTLVKLHSQFRMKLPYIPCPAERSYWFCRMCYPLVSTHLHTKTNYQYNSNNLKYIVLLILQKFLADHNHAKPIINPLCSISDEQFQEANDLLIGSSHYSVHYQKTTLNEQIALKIVMLYIAHKFHFQNPVNVIFSGEVLISSLFH